MIDLVFEVPDGTQIKHDNTSVVPNVGDHFFYENKTYKITHKMWNVDYSRPKVYIYAEVLW